MITVHTFASGSSGNAALLCAGQTRLLLDAGISCRRITAALERLNAAPQSLGAILITHTHTDHIAGLQVLLSRTACPVCATERTCRELAWRIAGIERRLRPLRAETPALLDGVEVTAIPTAHDAEGSCGYRFGCGGASVGLCTDTGYVTEEMQTLLPGAQLVLLEANHDPDLLRSGPYPAHVKARILGERGHLCNGDAARFAVTLARSGARHIVLAHLSRENNTPALAEGAVAAALAAEGLHVRLSVAPRASLSAAYCAGPEEELHAQDDPAVRRPAEGAFLSGGRCGI